MRGFFKWLLAAFLFLGVPTIIFILGKYLGDWVSSGAGELLGVTMVCVAGAIAQWFWGDFRDAPIVFKILGPCCSSVLITASTYRLLR